MSVVQVCSLQARVGDTGMVKGSYHPSKKLVLRPAWWQAPLQSRCNGTLQKEWAVNSQDCPVREAWIDTVLPDGLVICQVRELLQQRSLRRLKRWLAPQVLHAPASTPDANVICAARRSRAPRRRATGSSS